MQEHTYQIPGKDETLLDSTADIKFHMSNLPREVVQASAAVENAFQTVEIPADIAAAKQRSEMLARYREEYVRDDFALGA